MFYIKVSTILLVLALIVLAVFACVMMAAWWSRKEEQEETCKNCPSNVAGRCECLRKKQNPCDTCGRRNTSSAKAATGGRRMANEKRLIDLGDALWMVKNSREDCPETSIKGRAIWETAHNCALSCLTNCSAVDAVEVVRCKDCKEWEYDEDFSGWCAEWRKRTLGNHFCSYGERSEGE